LRREGKFGGMLTPDIGIVRIALDTPSTVGNHCLIGAGEMNRTPDLRITNALLYQLSYTGYGLQQSTR
jgi:hypothetical protein